MKTLSKFATTLLLAIAALQGNSQTLILCDGTSTVVTANNFQGLTSPTYSMNPGGVTSPNPTFVISAPAFNSYTLYTTGTNSNNVTVTTVNTLTVIPSGVAYTVTSPQNYTLGCASKSVCVVNITNAQTTPTPGGSVTYTFIAPGNPTLLPPGILSPLSVTSTAVPGTWYVGVRDNTNGCTSFQPINVILNNMPPVINNLTVSPNPLSCNASTAVVKAPSNALYQYQWWPSGTLANSVAVLSNTANPTQSVAVTLTLETTNLNNLCKYDTVVPVLQNLYPPNALMYAPPGVCQNTIVITNISTTGIPPGTFPTNGPVVGLLWEAPAPQPTLGLSSSYTAQISGIYTMTARDNNNGCTSAATINVNVAPLAAFVHTVASGTATFVDASAGTDTTSTYFWDFGDGNTSTSQNPIHTYSNAGSHLVKLKVTNAGLLCTDSVIQSVAITGIACSANSNFSMVPTGTPQVWNVIPAYPWNISAATWNWGDGSSSNTLYTTHQYSAAGMYSICLSVTVNCVASSSTCSSYSVYRATQSALMVQVNVIAPELISGIKVEGTAAEFSWNIVPNPNAGDFNVNLLNAGPEKIDVLIRDLTGRILHTQDFNAGNETLHLDTAKLPSGMYLVTVKAGHNSTTRRMVVNR